MRTVVLLSIVFSVAFGFVGRANPKMEKFLEKGEKENAVLDTCLKSAKSFFEDIVCFNKSIAAYPYNTTWHKSLAAAYMGADMRLLAHRSLNYSVIEVLRVQGFTKQDILMQDGAVGAIKLYAARDVTGAVEMAKVLMTVNQKIQNYSLMHSLFQAFHNYKEAKEVKTFHLTYYHNLLDTLHFKEALPYSDPALSHSGRVSTLLLTGVQSFIDHHFELPLYGRQFIQSEWTSCYGKQFEKFKDTRTVNEMIAMVGLCTKPIEDLLKLEGVHHPFGATNTSLTHVLVEFGFEKLVKILLSTSYAKIIFNHKTQHGQLPIHRAVSAGRVDIVKAILKYFPSQLNEPDGAGITPKKLLCEHKYYDLPMIQALSMRGSDDCDDANDRIDDDVAPEKRQGGWSADLKSSDVSNECDFDVRDAAAILPADFVSFYTVLEKPVLLRGAVRLSALADFQKETFLKKFGNFYGRREPFPNSESYGVHHVNQSKIKDFTPRMAHSFDVLTDNVLPGTFLSKVVEVLHPALFATEVTSLRYDDFNPIFTMGGVDAGSNSRFHYAPTFNSLAFGVREWALQPPPAAVVSKISPKVWKKEHVPEIKPTLKCLQYSGDILVVPRLWSSSYVNVRPSLGIERPFDFRLSPKKQATKK